LITDLEIGGTPTVVRELAIRLQNPPNVEIEVACLSKWGPVADQIREAGVDVTAFDARGGRDLLGVVRRLVRLIRDRSFDTVLSFLIHANAVAAIASRFCRDLRFIQSIQTTQPKPRWHWWVQSVAQTAAEKILVPSESAARAARDWGLVAAAKIEVIPNAVDDSLFRNTGFQPVPERAHGLESRVTVGFLGRLDPIKRVPDLVRAMALLDKRFCLEIFGEGAERSNIEREIDRSSLSGRVTLRGATAKPQAAIQRFDVLVLPSQAEGFGLVLIEAMAAGVPVVATDVPGIRDVVRHELTGLLVPVSSPTELARAIRRIAEDSSLSSKLVTQARNDVRQRFSWDAVLPEYRRLLDLED
jgi:glycosyltransferase involved in cell wall biosynthesis